MDEQVIRLTCHETEEVRLPNFSGLRARFHLCLCVNQMNRRAGSSVMNKGFRGRSIRYEMSGYFRQRKPYVTGCKITLRLSLLCDRNYSEYLTIKLSSKIWKVKDSLR